MKHLPAAAALAAALYLPTLSFNAATAAENVVVTASRVPLPVESIGSSVSIIDEATIDARMPVFAIDLLGQVPGLAVSRAGGAGTQTQVRLRGAEANHVLVLIDGVEANNPAGDDAFAFEHLTALDIERIEVVRGPQSALWGSDALSGTINIVTRAPGKSPGATLYGEGGAYDSRLAGGNFAWAGHPIEGSLSLSHHDTDGNNVSRLGSERDGYRNTTAGLRLAMQPTEALKLDFGTRYTDTRSEFDTSDFVTGLPTDSTHETEYSQLTMHANATLGQPGGAWQHGIHATWLRTDTDNIAPDGFDTAQDADRFNLRAQSTHRLTGNTDIGAGQSLTVAIDHERDDFSQRGTSLFGDPRQDQRLYNTALVGEWLARPTQDLTLTLGLRHDRNSDFDDETTWRGTLAWHVPRSGTRLRAAWGTGQKAPTFIERFGFFPDQFIGNPDLEPEKSRGWELGIDQNLAEGRVSAGLTWFNEKLRDEIDGFADCAFDPVTFAFICTARNLDGKSHRKGIEASLQARITDDVDIGASWTHVESTAADDSGVQRREIRRPRNIASVDARLRFADQRAGLYLGLVYNGNQTDLDFGSFPAETARLNAYYLLTVTGTWRITPHVGIYARVDNALGDDYENVLGYAPPGTAGHLGIRVSLASPRR